MDWIIPGTVLTIPRENISRIEQQFNSLFMGGGIVLSQVTGITGLEAYTIQNWVKRGFLSPPERKKYSMNQLCRIININMMKNVLPMERICSMLSYINGHLDDESDDIIDDSRLYFMFLRLAAHYRVMQNESGRDTLIAQELKNYVEPVPGAKDRVTNVLRIMLTAWACAQLRQTTEQLLKEIE
jgi:DNA-binding transcriptional MerR regulator